MRLFEIIITVLVIVSFVLSVYEIFNLNEKTSELDTKISANSNEINSNKEAVTSLKEEVQISNNNINILKNDLEGHKSRFKSDVLTMLNQNCQIWSVSNPTGNREVTGDDICNERGAGTCILMINYDRLSSQDMIQRCTPYVTGRDDKTVAYCCRI